MEYTKDIILDLGYKRKTNLNKISDWTSILKKIVKNNRFIISIMTLLIILTIIDVLLVDKFIKILATLY